MSNISRRTALSAFPIAAVAIAAPAVALTADQGPDTALEAAWQRTVDASDTLDAIGVDGAPDSPAEMQQYRIMDEAESFIQSATAKTTHGASIQLWLALRHMIDGRKHDEIIKRRDIDALLHDAGLDWNEKCVVAALHSLAAVKAR